MKFAVLKGREGFGDRLQCLLQAIRYATATGRVLVVDWRDSDWAHDKRLNFEHYFKFIGLTNFPYEAFERYLDDHLSELTVIPRAWKPRLLHDDYERFIFSPVFQMDNSQQRIWKIANWKMDDFEEDIVVLPVKGVRSFSYQDFGTLIAQPWVEERVRHYAASHGLQSGGYGVIHLRAGSKTWAGGWEEGNHALTKTIGEKFPSLETYLETVHKDLLSKQKRAQKEASDVKSDGQPDLIILSDSTWIAEEWTGRYGVGRTLDRVDIGEFNNLSGSHKMSPERLTEIGSSKTELNYETLLDFYLMLNATYVARDGVSLFSQMGDKIRSMEGVYFQF